MDGKNILVLGVGNLLLGDEGVGIHVARRLQELPLPPGVEVIDGGTLGLELINHCRRKKKIVIIDAVITDAEPGTMFRFTPEEAALRWSSTFSSHDIGLRELLHFLTQLHAGPEIVIIGIVPKDINSTRIGLSTTLEKGLSSFVRMIVEELRGIPIIASASN